MQTPSTPTYTVETRWSSRPLTDAEFAALGGLIFDEDPEQATNTAQRRGGGK
ncbi:hypothetical protein LEP48_08605 [Isoptericola sp. NEAU-Y5]|uniref:Uncharacterized protein n=1 Tax=Isoptericola luteus TaxID=2879484 RepID=A0ABS7ZED9_9MICO|nr:hypothetical protein [Isoptericola sp. NEAU-Y5]MCA5893410.1 hypothetical protein [Isoptericola sp. NEAU-Y5]